jgi:imidazolonepropionase
MTTNISAETAVAVDLIIHPVGEIVTPDSVGGPVREEKLAAVKRIKDGAIAVKDGRIVMCGPAKLVNSSVKTNERTRTVDASGKLITPGFVDPHTHLVFGGNRANEFQMRCQGKKYAEIAAAGGGIVASMRGTREATLEQLVELGRQRLDLMLAHGTTTVEVKTGYGLDLDSELRMLEAILALDSVHPVDVVATFMPAHAVPPGDKRERYVEEIVETIMPAALKILRDKGRSADSMFIDVFCDEGYFTLADTEKIFARGQELGMKLKVHADEFASLGATRLAATAGAASADHLLAITAEDIRILAQSDTVAVLLPGTSFFLNLKEHAPARTMIERGVAIAVGSDFNPGSCHIFSAPLIMGLACLHLGLTPEEALTAMTLNAAYAIGRGEDVGQLSEGYQADMVVWNVATLEEIPYNMGWNPVSTTIKKGNVFSSRS